MSRKDRRSPQTAIPPLPPRVVVLSATGVFVLLLIVYLATLLRTVVDQDSGELVSACHVLGIAHPTGYPLWVLLGRLFDFLPVGGTSAFRVGLLSAVCSAGAGALIAALSTGLTGAWLPGMAAGLVFGLWFPTWSQAVRAEVYGLTGLLFALAVAAFLRWDKERSSRRLCVVALSCGFVAMHHRTAMLAVLPALLVALVLTRPRRARMYVGAGLSFLVPFLCYAYLPIRAAARPPVNWTNPATWDRFWDHMMATQYQGFALSHTVEQMAQEAAKLRPEVLAPGAGWSLVLALIGLPLIVWGAAWWWRRQPWAAGSLAVGACLLVFWVLQWGETTDLKVFLLPLAVVLALYGAVGLTRLSERLPPGTTRWSAIAAVGVVVCGAQVRANWERSDLSNLWQHRDRWVVMLSQLEPKAIFISDNDVPSFATMYLQTVEGMRPDVTLIRVIPLQTDWYIDLIEDATVREATRQAWGETQTAVRELGLRDPLEMKWERTALFAYSLARRLEGVRPIYVLHGPMRLELPQPPYFVGLSEDLVALRFEPPQLVRERAPGPPLGEYAEGVELVAFEWDHAEAGTGELVQFRSEWRLKGDVAMPLQFGVRLCPQGLSPEQFPSELSRDGFFTQAFPLAYGERSLGPSAEGTVYEQRGWFIVPTNAAAGAYRTFVGLGPLYLEEYTGWTDVGGIQVQARPRPRNGP
jgi:hypothetical protein